MVAVPIYLFTMARFGDVLKNRNFFVLWVGQIVSEFGDRLTLLALIALASKRAPGSTFALAKVLTFVVIPVFVIGPVAGAYVDRWDRKYTMIASDLLRAALVFLIPLCLIYLKAIIPIYILVFLVFSVTRFFLPSKMAIIPELVSQDKLLVANSLVSTTRTIAMVIGFGLAGVLIGKFGYIGGFYIDSGTYLFSAALLSVITVGGRLRLKQDLIETGRALEEALVKKTIFGQIREGLKYLAKDADVKFSLVSLFLLMAMVGALCVVTIVFVQEAFGSVVLDVAKLGMLLGAGLFFGTLAYGRLGHLFSKRKAIYLSFLGSGTAVILFAVMVRRLASFAVAGPLVAILGAAAAPVVVSAYTLIHEAIPENVRGRVFSAVEAVIHVAFLLCMFLAATLAEYIDKFWILIWCGGFFAMAGLLGIIKKTK